MLGLGVTVADHEREGEDVHDQLLAQRGRELSHAHLVRVRARARVRARIPNPIPRVRARIPNPIT